MAEKQNKDQLIQMTHDGKNFSEVPRHAFDSLWSQKGWKEAKLEDVYSPRKPPCLLMELRRCFFSG